MAGIVLNMHVALNQFIKGILLLLSSLLAIQAVYAQQSEQRNSNKTVPNKATSLLEQELRGKGLVMLEAGGNTFSAIWQPDTSSNTLGAVLIFHGSGQNINWPESIAELSKALSLHGWASLSISLPERVKTAPPQRPTPTPSPATDSTAANANSTSEPPEEPKPKIKTEQDVEREVRARAKAGMDYLNSQGQYNIVFAGEGLGAARAARYLDTLSKGFNKQGVARTMGNAKTQAVISRPVRALIIINARNHIIPDMREQNSLMDWLNDPGLPILDVYAPTHHLDQLESEQREKQAQKKRMEKYFQVQLNKPDLEESSGETMLSKRVRGFLNKHAKGVEIESD